VKDVTLEIIRNLMVSNLETPRRIRRFTIKPESAPLTKTEQRVIQAIPTEGLHLGFVSYPLAYSKALDGFSIAEKKALVSLLHRGRLRILETFSPQDRIIMGV